MSEIVLSGIVEEKKPITIGDLIKYLEKFPPDFFILTYPDARVPMTHEKIYPPYDTEHTVWI